MKKIFEPWSVILLTSDSSHVIRMNIPKILIYFFIILILTIGTVLSLSLYKNAKMTKENSMLKDKLVTIQEKNELLTEKHVQLKTEANQIENKLERLKSLESELKQMMTSLNPKYIEQNHSSQGRGGIEHSPINMNVSMSIDNLSKDKDAELLSKQYVNIKEKIPTLIDHYESTLKDIEKLKEELKVVPTIWPTNSTRITSSFGNRRDPFTQHLSFHAGIDIGGTVHSPIYATADGKVTFVGKNGGYGKFIQLYHSSKYTTQYGHLSDYNVEIGDYVKKGEIIGYMGNTGRSTGVHLHYEILRNGTPVDPYPYMTFLE